MIDAEWAESNEKLIFRFQLLRYGRYVGGNIQGEVSLPPGQTEPVHRFKRFSKLFEFFQIFKKDFRAV